MSIVSYAQNFEDVMLWRALQHVREGFYIDVGANDPLVDSVTQLFYERGWRGINVEPMAHYHAMLEVARPRDVNTRAAAGEHPGRMTFYEVAGTGLSTLDDAVARQHADAGRAVTRHEVEVTTLSQLCEAHVQGPIHFLKIDVEGHEAPVLRGMDFKRWRPWVLLIEATRPQSQVLATEAWEPLVLAAGYRKAYFDGLNQFYVAQEHEELLAAFNAPPNYFDHFKLRPGHFYSHPQESLGSLDEGQAAALAMRMRAEVEAAIDQRLSLAIRAAQVEQTQLWQQAIGEVRQVAADVHAMVLRAEAQMQQSQPLQDELARTRQQLNDVLASRSWRVTRPLRWVTGALRMRGLPLRLRRLAGKLLDLVGLRAQASRLRHRYFPDAWPQPADMTPRARSVYDDVQRAMGRERALRRPRKG